MMPAQAAARAASAATLGDLSEHRRAGHRRPVAAGIARRAAAWLPAVLVVLLASLLAEPAAATTPAGPAAASAAQPAPADVDVDSLVSQALDQMQSSSVALLARSGADRSGLQAIVGDARGDDVTLWIVSIGPGARPTQAQNTEIGDRILAAKHGTVFVLSSEWIAVRSDDYTSEQRQAASDAAGDAGSSDTSAARAALDSLTAKSFPWGWVIVAVVAAVILLALAGGWWERRRRRRADAEELARLTRGLADRVGALAPSIVSLSDQVDLADDPDVSERFNRASTGYNTLRDKLATPLPSRRAVKKADGEVAALEGTIAALTASVAQRP